MDEDRKAFEAIISAPPFERSIGRYGVTSAWEGTYRDRAVDLAWHAWQAAIAYERERVAKVCDAKASKFRKLADAMDEGRPYYLDMLMHFASAAAEIRKGT